MITLALMLAAIDDERDKERFTHLYIKYQNYANNVASYFVKTKEDAEDIAQKAFFYISRRRAKEFVSMEEEHAKKYLAFIIRAYGKNFIRDNSKLEVVSMSRLEENGIGFREMVNRYQVEEIKSALRLLSENESACLELYYLEGRKTKEIAEMLSISDAAVRKRLERARRSMRKILEEAEMNG